MSPCPSLCTSLFLKRSARPHLFLCFLPAGRVRTRRQSSGSTLSTSSTVTDSRGRTRAKVVSQSQRKCLCRIVYLVLIHLQNILQYNSSLITKNQCYTQISNIVKCLVKKVFVVEVFVILVFKLCWFGFKTSLFYSYEDLLKNTI